jgi:hypothetical protein
MGLKPQRNSGFKTYIALQIFIPGYPAVGFCAQIKVRSRLNHSMNCTGKSSNSASTAGK